MYFLFFIFLRQDFDSRPKSGIQLAHNITSNCSRHYQDATLKYLNKMRKKHLKWLDIPAMLSSSKTPGIRTEIPDSLLSLSVKVTQFKMMSKKCSGSAYKCARIQYIHQKGDVPV